MADGVVRAQGRKLLFTTNLPNVGDIDDALQQPRRCFATLEIRPLHATEVRLLALKLPGGDRAVTERVFERALAEGARNATLAAVYRAWSMEKLS